MRLYLLSARVLSSFALRMDTPLIAALEAATMVKSFPVKPSSTSIFAKVRMGCLGDVGECVQQALLEIASSISNGAWRGREAQAACRAPLLRYGSASAPVADRRRNFFNKSSICAILHCSHHGIFLDLPIVGH